MGLNWTKHDRGAVDISSSGKAAGTAGAKGDAAEDCPRFPAEQVWAGGEHPADCRGSEALSDFREIPRRGS